MDLLITDALSYNRAVRQELALAPVELGPLLQGMLDTYPEFIAHRPRIRLEGDLPVVVGNKAGLTQCFSNLIGNALKFVPPNQEPDVRIWAESMKSPEPNGVETAWVRVCVEDKGIGISARMLPRIFSMFTRGSSQHEGTGIGLALVRKVVERMGGRVGVESTPGQGSRFWLELKCADRSSLACDPPSVSGSRL
jgi:signal transduction histidine kinase